MMKALTILLVPVIGLAALGARAAEGTSLTGTGIVHHGNGDGAPACSSCHGEHFQGEPLESAGACGAASGVHRVSPSRLRPAPKVTTPSCDRLRQRSAPRSGRRWLTTSLSFRSP